MRRLPPIDANEKFFPKPDELVAKLIPWYHEVRRALPWRINRDPYRIWISEVMLQQTTVTAVIPYYQRFMERFPDLQSLATAKLEMVLENWAGLGYYSRARSLHASAQKLFELGKFPETFPELLKLPGFGPYTARAVSSLAFGEKVGAVDGNVIRVLSRVFDLDLEWWRPVDRKAIQSQVDLLANARVGKRPVDSSDVNQALMELGATICTPQSPTCMLCPWSRQCLARRHDTIGLRPKPKPRRATEIWAWNPAVQLRRDGRVLLVENNYAPFLKGHLIPPGTATRLKKKPKTFHYRGSVTHHEIYVTVSPANAAVRAKKNRSIESKSQWIAHDEIKSKIPSSLIRKALDAAKKS